MLLRVLHNMNQEINSRCWSIQRRLSKCAIFLHFKMPFRYESLTHLSSSNYYLDSIIASFKSIPRSFLAIYTNTLHLSPFHLGQYSYHLTFIMDSPVSANFQVSDELLVPCPHMVTPKNCQKSVKGNRKGPKKALKHVIKLFRSSARQTKHSSQRPKSEALSKSPIMPSNLE